MAGKDYDIDLGENPSGGGGGGQRPGGGQPQSGEQQRQVRIELDDSGVVGLYANLCRVSSTPEEVILDLALNPNPLAGVDQRLRVSQRVILNHFTAKRLASMLVAVVQRHEQAFGELETDVRKRVVQQPQQPTGDNA